MKNPQKLEYLAFQITKRIGSPTSIIVHTFIFIGIFALHPLFSWSFDKILLVLTTLVSLEAIYLAIFIQMSVNQNTLRLSKVSEDVVEIQEDVGEIQEDVEEITEDVGGLEENIKELSHDVEGITEELEEDEMLANAKRSENKQAIEKVEQAILHLLHNLEELKNKNDSFTKRQNQNHPE